jgi:hypothetical protein
MSTKTITAAIVGAILIAALALFSQRAPQPGVDAASEERSTPLQTEATPAAQPRSPDATAVSNDATAVSNDAPAPR